MSIIGYSLYLFHRNASSIDIVPVVSLITSAIFLQIRSGLYDNLHLVYTVLVVIWGTRIAYVSTKRVVADHPRE